MSSGCALLRRACRLGSNAVDSSSRNEQLQLQMCTVVCQTGCVDSMPSVHDDDVCVGVGLVLLLGSAPGIDCC